MLIVHEDNFPVCYLDWAQWREIRIGEEDDLAEPHPEATCFCGFCWGAGRIYEHAANGEGLIPARCERCDGRGQVPVDA